MLGLHFEADGENLRLHDPATGHWLRTPPEEREFAAETATQLNLTATKLDTAAAERDQVLADKAMLEQELANLRRRLGETGSS